MICTREKSENPFVKKMQRAKLAAAYLLLALAAALGWLYSCLPDRVYLEPGQALYLPRFAWVEPQRGHGSQNVASTRAVGSYQTTLTLGGWLPLCPLHFLHAHGLPRCFWGYYAEATRELSFGS